MIDEEEHVNGELIFFVDMNLGRVVGGETISQYELKQFDDNEEQLDDD